MDELALKHFKDAEVVAVADHHPVLVVLLHLDIVHGFPLAAQQNAGGVSPVRQKAVAAVFRRVLPGIESAVRPDLRQVDAVVLISIHAPV